MTRTEMEAQLAEVRAELRGQPNSLRSKATWLHYEELLTDALRRLDEQAQLEKTHVRRYFVVQLGTSFSLEAQAQNYASGGYGNVVVAVDVPKLPTFKGTLLPEDDG